MPLLVEIAIAAAACGICELFAWCYEVLWHRSESKNVDGRNWAPPR